LSARLPSLSFGARVFAALVGISATVSLVIGLVLYYFAQDRLYAQERELLVQRSRMANESAGVFLEGLRDPESGALPTPDTYADELVRATAGPTSLGVLYAGPDGEPLAARDGAGDPTSPESTLSRIGLDETFLREVGSAAEGEGQLVPVDDDAGRITTPHYVAVWPLTGPDGGAQGVLIYSTSDEGLDDTLAFLRYGILGAIGASVLLAGLGSLILARQITYPLSLTRDAAIQVASGDYTFVPVESDDELGEVARAFNYMAGEVQHYVGEMQRQKSRLEAVLAASPEAIVATDARERVIMANPAAMRVLGIDYASAHGRPLAKLNAPEAILDCLREATKKGAAVREIEAGEKILWAYAARIAAAYATDTAENGPKNAAGGGGAILAVRDITEHRSLERAKTAFVSDVSHELRTPLTTIQSAVSLIERAGERLDPLERRALELASGELVRIRGMVEELLTLAQMDSRQYTLEVAPTDLDEVIRSALDAIEAKARRFEIELTYRAEDPLTLGGGRIVCDAHKVYQVMLNLLDNAIKYSDPGAQVSVSLVDEGEFVLLRVADTGVGIPEEDLPQLFERFYRVDKDRSRATGGSGLGLAICKQIVQLHGGSLSVESEPGVGSTFDVRLPKNLASPHAP
jgi:signal transduction histidine kinase